MLGDVMLWLLIIGAVVLGCVLAYGILRARERLDRNTKRTQRSENRRNVRSQDHPSAVGTGVADAAHYFVKGS